VGGAAAGEREGLQQCNEEDKGAMGPFALYGYKVEPPVVVLSKVN
jgi:hypothetical protein